MPKVLTPAAAIDLGSNSFRIMIGFRSGHELVSLARKRAPVRLATGLTRTGIIATDTVKAALAALTSFRREIDHFGIDRVRCCGTEALRQATNGHDLIEPAEKILGSTIEILTGREEAELSTLGVRDALADILSFPCLIADVGGGSCELILLKSPDSAAVVTSLPVGAVMLAELESASRIQVLRTFSGQINDFLKETGLDMIQTMVGTGGTSCVLAMLAQQMTVHDATRINGFCLSLPHISEIYRSLSALSTNQRKVLPGIETGREEIIISGLEIYQEILATIGATGMIVSDAGLLEGILFSITGAYLD